MIYKLFITVWAGTYVHTIYLNKNVNFLFLGYFHIKSFLQQHF